MISVSIDVPQADIDETRNMLMRYAEKFNGNVDKVLERAMVRMVVALRASTKKSKELRRIVRNPNRYTGTARQTNKYGRTHAHIQAWYEYNTPKHRTGRHLAWLPKLKQLVDRKASSKMAIERFTQSKGVRYTPIPVVKTVGEGQQIAAQFFKKSYKIQRQGLARMSWGWMLKKLGRGSESGFGEVLNKEVSVSKTDTAANGVRDISIEASNRLNYIRRATKADVGSFLARANKMMLFDLEGHKKSVSQSTGMAA